MILRLRRTSRALSASIPTTFNAALVIALVIAFAWWLIALLLREGQIAPVWYDQASNFTRLGFHIADPYSVPGFVNPPWTALLLAPFAVFPLPVATLIEMCLYFGLLTAVIFRYGGDTKTVLIALVSFVALDSAIELNLDWLVCLGLLVPAAWSGPLLLVKPQDALGYWISLKRRDFVRAIIVVLFVVDASLFVWWGWPLQMLHAIQINTLGHFYNLAPMALLPWWLSVIIGLFLSWRAFKRRDPVLAILAWVFFVPYLTYYALLLPFALLAIRLPRIALLFSVVMWIIFGGTVLLGVLHLTAPH